MQKNSNIYLAGHRGLVGSAIHRKLTEKGYHNILTRTSKELDLKDQQQTAQFFQTEKPEYVILAAAKVGGIMANNTYRAEFLYDNVQIQNNVIHQSYRQGVKKLLFLGSSCIYPKNCPQPMKEHYLLTDELEYTNEPYAIAKITGMKMCEEYNIQYGTNFLSVMPTNLYGPNDNYDLETSHVLPALIRKMHMGKCLEQEDWQSLRKDLDNLPVKGIDGKAKENEILQVLQKQGIQITQSADHTSSPGQCVTINLWGTGTPRREFLHSGDMADACVHILENTDFADLLRFSFSNEDSNNQIEQLLSEAKKTKSAPHTFRQSQNSTSGNIAAIPQNPYHKLVSQHSIPVKNTHINIGTGKDLSIKELAEIIKRIAGFRGEINWNTDMPDGTYQKLLDISKLKELGWQEKIGLKEGIAATYDQYLQKIACK
jgi:GDP-L-fucose synthase